MAAARRLARGKGRCGKDARVRQAAEDCALAIQARLHPRRDADLLLRPTSAPTDTLLRPASAPSSADTERLLRPAEPEGESARHEQASDEEAARQSQDGGSRL
jgi:hypothetical protein